MEMFRQIAPKGDVSKESVAAQLHGDFEDEHEPINLEGPSGDDAVPSVHKEAGETHEDVNEMKSSGCPFMG